MIENAALEQYTYLESKSKTSKKEFGQYFTGSIVADYMASMLEFVDTPTVRILDAGAGVGILTISVALRCLDIGNYHVHAVLYEINENTLSHLELNMRRIARLFKNKSGKFTFDIRNNDFVLDRPDKMDETFHLSSINPPYFKYNSKTSIYARATTDLYKGNPNIYASFMAIVTASMKPNGQMIVIVPRSFTNGLYFKGFRQYMNQTMSLEKIHIFKSRNKVFKKLSVIQENIICSYRRSKQKEKIEIYTSTGCGDIKETNKNTYLSKFLIDKTNEHQIIRIPETLEDAQVMQIVEGWSSSFHNNGYFISTGPVVEHRTREFITEGISKTNSVPLLRMHNIKTFETEWLGTNKKDASFLLLNGHLKHTRKNKPYVLLKRFSSKDEKRRLTASVYNPETIKSDLIALENHLNYIGQEDDDFAREETYGLTVLFNSTLMDKYFRCISGNTQVNATEIRLLKLPSRDCITKIGYAFLKTQISDQQSIDQLINLYLKH